MSKSEKAIPQIVSFVKVTKDGRINLKKAARQHLGMNGCRFLNLDTKLEILISAGARKGKRIYPDEKNNILLPDDIWKKLSVDKGALVALIERDKALAVKKAEIVEAEGDQARWLDIETAYKVTRKIETNPVPERFRKKLIEKHRNSSLKYNVRAFLKERQTLEAWMSRRILGSPESSDEKLIKLLVEERMNKQQENGSWGNNVPVTARNLRELADLGLTRKNTQIRKAIDWLINRPQSVYNPGLWFAADELIKEQAQVIKRRQKHTDKGPRERFNKRNALETNVVRAAESLAIDPCGPRIMWTTALVMEALLRFGCESNRRVKKAIRTLTINPHWCDNTYQHGLSEWKRTTPPSLKIIKAFKKYSTESFKYGGIFNPQILLRADASHQPFHFRRVTHFSNKGVERYLLNMPDAGEGCNIIMVRALNRIKNEKLKKILELYLWRYAGLQNFKDGTFRLNPHRIFTDIQTVFLQIFPRYKHPVSKLVILRALPWIIKNQNKDGSWGTELIKDTTTLAVVNALLSLGDDLPYGCFP